MKVSKDFELQEFIPKEIYNAFRENSTWFINPTIINIAQVVRDICGVPIIINNWNNGGSYNNRGYRLPSSPIGAVYSQHKLGNAIDISSNEMNAKKLYELILANKGLLLLNGLSAIEDIRHTKTWVHLDCRFIKNKKEILIFNP